MKYESKDMRYDYRAPLLGNGDIALNPDCEGNVFENQPVGEFARAGRRQMNKPGQLAPAPLLPWGGLTFNCKSKVSTFSHTLHETDGYVSSVCKYENGNEIETKCFIHQNFNMYAVKKHTKNPCDITFAFEFSEVLLENASDILYTNAGNSVYADMKIRAYDTYFARIAIVTDKLAEIKTDDKKIELSVSLKAGEEVSFYFCLEDSLYDDDYKEKIKFVIEDVTERGYDALLSDNKKTWNEYHANGYIKINDEKIDSAYRTAMYHLKCYTTRWSIPVAISNKCWSGKFFAFDEYYSYLALLESNKTELAKRVPSFRVKGLESAIARGTDYSKNPDMIHARYPWQTGEQYQELTRPGFWQEHIFHMAAIALGAYQYFEYSSDFEFLKECYPMIKACAKFYTINSIYQDQDGSYYVGKCTDLERLGAGVERAFFTTCGVIKTLEVLADSSKMLGVDEEYRNECIEKAESLRKSLPHDGGKYVPFPGSKQKSIAVFTGKYPFDVLDNNDEKLMPALLDFLENELEFGNMYPTGKRVCIWYAAWKAIAFARMKQSNLAYDCFLQATESLGAFTEVFEINEESKVYRPWFSTAAGVFATALNEMLIQSDGKNIYLLPALPEYMANISFRLSVKGGAIAEVSIKNNKLEKLNIEFLPGVKEKTFNVFLRGEKIS